MKVRFLQFTESGKMLISLDCDKPHMYIIITKATTVKTKQRDMLKINQDVNLKKKIQVTYRKSRTTKQRPKK